jgi:transcriptional regulator with XRE-family HTH domain
MVVASKTKAVQEPLRLILAENIRSYRRKRGLSQEQLADLCGYHRTYIGSVERCERNVSLSTLAALAAALKTQVPALLTKHHEDA